MQTLNRFQQRASTVARPNIQPVFVKRVTGTLKPRTPKMGPAVLRPKRQAQAILAAVATQAATDAEQKANHQRWLESGGGKGSADEWRWSLNWNQINDDIVVGACPRSPQDLDRLVDEAGIDCIVSLQSDTCLEAMAINWLAIRERGIERNVLVMRIPTRDFDRHDQTLMLPEAVKAIALMVGLGRKVYVHCTAGINRAPLAVVGYLTFVKGMSLKEATSLVKSRRQQANPYIECWKAVRTHFLEGETEQVGRIAQQVYKVRREAGKDGDGFSDWVAAEDLVVREIFQRQLAVTFAALSSLKDLEAAGLEKLKRTYDSTMDITQHEVLALTAAKEEERKQLLQAQDELAKAKAEIAELRAAGSRQAAINQAAANGQGVDSVLLKLSSAQREISTLKTAIRNMAIATYAALSLVGADAEQANGSPEVVAACTAAADAVKALAPDAEQAQAAQQPTAQQSAHQPTEQVDSSANGPWTGL